jgi:hypothetical protein
MDIQNGLALRNAQRRASLNVQKKQKQSQEGRRVVSETLVSQRALISGPEADRASSVKIQSEDSTPSIKAPLEGTPNPEPRLYHTEIEGTILLTRLKEDNIFRKVPLTTTRTVDSLFNMCAQRWPEKFGAGGISRLLYIDDENNLVEIVEGSSGDYKELLRLIQRRWDNAKGGKEVIQVKVILLAAGESNEL